MNSACFVVHLEQGSKTYQHLEDVYTFLKTEGFISIFRYNDNETGKAFAETADEYCVSAEEREQLPVFVLPAVSDEGTFVKSEVFWIENYLLDEFYNPERMPYIEVLASENE